MICASITVVWKSSSLLHRVGINDNCTVVYADPWVFLCWHCSVIILLNSSWRCGFSCAVPSFTFLCFFHVPHIWKLKGKQILCKLGLIYAEQKLLSIWFERGGEEEAEIQCDQVDQSQLLLSMSIWYVVTFLRMHMSGYSYSLTCRFLDCGRKYLENTYSSTRRTCKLHRNVPARIRTRKFQAMRQHCKTTIPLCCSSCPVFPALFWNSGIRKGAY